MSDKITDPRAYGERRKIRRNRRGSYPPDAVSTDGLGNILDRPILKNLLCFADPIEWLMGRGDKKHRFGDKEPQPTGCAGCSVAASCARVADERLKSVLEVQEAFRSWEQDSYHLDYTERFKIPSWTSLVGAINKCQWGDPNEERLAEVRAAARREREETKHHRNGAAKKTSKSPRSVSRSIRESIEEYRAAREDELRRMKEVPNAPLWVRNRDIDRLVLIATAWATRELLERANLPSSGRAVLEQLQRDRQVAANVPPSMKKRIEEMLAKADDLIEKGDWPFFDPLSETMPSEMGHGMHADTVWKQIDP